MENTKTISEIIAQAEEPFQTQLNDLAKNNFMVGLFAITGFVPPDAAKDGRSMLYQVITVFAGLAEVEKSDPIYEYRDSLPLEHAESV